ncbi:MAG: hypothetical protein HUK00_05500 [Bacteroidaceae bacterium]|nr:hypothetical protein [Bacteroidaceae bacterium]
MCKERKPWADYVGYDLLGYEFNRKYPPDTDRFTNEFGGYASPNKETFFYDFCILQYGVAFSYEGEHFEAEFTDDGPILTNQSSHEIQGPFCDAVNLLEEANLHGKRMVGVLDDLQNIVLH